MSIIHTLVHRLHLGDPLGPKTGPITLEKIGKCSVRAQTLMQAIHEDCFPRVHYWKDGHLEILYPKDQHTKDVGEAFRKLRGENPTVQVGRDMDIHFMSASYVSPHIDKEKLGTYGTYQILIPTGIFEVDRRVWKTSNAYKAIMEDKKKASTEKPAIPYGSIISDPEARVFMKRYFPGKNPYHEKLEPYSIYVLDTDIPHSLSGINIGLTLSFVGFRARKNRIHELLAGNIQCNAIEGTRNSHSPEK